VKLDPEIENARKSSRKWEFDLPIRDDLSCLPGHFRGYPVVPGVLQLDWVIRHALEWRSSEPSSFRLEGLKFRRPLRPGQRPVVTLEANDALDRFRFRLADADGDFCIGRLICVDAADA
jgi:3-hydroxymyristoyl/3-hydroxydecanoyl-(acyl carrier protein) dehydratase